MLIKTIKFSFMEDTRIEKLGNYILDIAAGPFGSNLKVECFVPTGFPIIDGANLKGFKVTDNVSKFVTEAKARSLHRSIAKRNDVVVTISGNVGQISYIPEESAYEEYLVSQRQFRVTFDTSRVYVPYLVYYFHTLEGQHKILSFANQTGVPALAQPLKNFKNIDIVLPSLVEQQQIAEVLKSLDNKIEVNRRINDNLEQQAQALFKSWFVDFEPFRDQPFVESELGMIPEGWRVGTLFDVAEIFDKQRKPLSGKEREGMKRLYPYYGATSCMDYVDNYLFDGIYTLIGEDGSVAKEDGSPYMQYVWGKFWVNNHAHILQGKNGFSTEMIYVLLSTTNIQHLVTGAVQAKLSQANMQKIVLAIPPTNVLNQVRPVIDSMYETRREREDESRRLAELRDTLLPRLMSGELSVDGLKGQFAVSPGQHPGAKAISPGQHPGA